MYEEITKHTQVVVSELLEQAKLKPGSLFVVGCSSSEMVGKLIGKGSSMDAAKAAFLGVYPLLQKAGIHLAVQCCEHLNLALIMERTAAEAKGYEIVNVMPQPHAGGSMAVTAWNAFEDPVAVEKIQADAGMDIGGTLIGMHLRQDNPVIPPRFAAILRKHPFPTVKNAYSHKKTKLCLWYGYRSDGHFIIEMIWRVLLTRTFMHGEENNGDFLRIFCVPTVLTAVLPGGKVSTIIELPYVLECGVCAAPDEVRGQVVKACIVLVKGTEGTDELKKEIQNYVKAHTAPYKYPRIVEFREELPKTISGKIQRNKL